ncbi:MAG TPA: nucleotidyltransferase family protein [Methylobacterium sp.]|jgi:molybdenum cofactor cytidylyltransferase
MPELRIGVVLLAAGRGTRFGPEPKLLQPLDGKPLVRRAAEAAFASGLRPIVVVLGANAAPVRAALADLDPAFVENPRYAEGLSTSLRIGLDALPGTVTAAVVMLGDMPRIAGHHLDCLASAFRAAPNAAAIVPVSGGRRGNPVLLNRARLATELIALVGDRGAGSLLAARSDVVEIAMDAAVGQDVDTNEALAALRQA